MMARLVLETQIFHEQGVVRIDSLRFASLRHNGSILPLSVFLFFFSIAGPKLLMRAHFQGLAIHWKGQLLSPATIRKRPSTHAGALHTELHR